MYPRLLFTYSCIHNVFYVPTMPPVYIYIYLLLKIEPRDSSNYSIPYPKFCSKICKLLSFPKRGGGVLILKKKEWLPIHRYYLVGSRCLNIYMWSVSGLYFRDRPILKSFPLLSYDKAVQFSVIVSTPVTPVVPTWKI